MTTEGEGDADCIDGDRFAVEPLTPFLTRQVEHLERELGRHLDGDRWRLTRNTGLRINGSRLHTDLVIRRQDQDPPAAVIDVRRESTDRFALGVKRLAYAVARIPTYWFLDARARSLCVLTLDPANRRYRWPAPWYKEGDTVTVPGPEGIRLPLADLLLPMSPPGPASSP